MASLTAADVKLKVQQEMEAKLEGEVEEKTNLLKQMRSELQVQTAAMLTSNLNFLKTWNCTQLGRDIRSNMKPTKIKEIAAQKNDLEYQLRDYLAAEKQYEAAVAEKIQLENEMKPEEQMLSAKADDLLRQIQRINCTLLNLNNKYTEMKKQQRNTSSSSNYFLKRVITDELTKFNGNTDNMGTSIIGDKKQQHKPCQYHFKKRNVQTTQQS